MTPVFFRSSCAFRRWLETHHDSAAELWVGFYKKHSAKRGISCAEVLDQALCYGSVRICGSFFRMRSMRLLIVAFAVVASLDPLTRAQGARIEQLGWLAGCWEMSSPRGTIEEQWSAPRGQTMLGTGRTVRDGRTTEYEFVVLKEQDGRFAYEAHPSQQPSAVFLSREATASRVVFENLDHDFPQRVGYERQAADAMLAWIEGTRTVVCAAWNFGIGEWRAAEECAL